MRDDSFKDFVLDQLRDVSHVKCKAMFGGFGLYVGDAFFGIISEQRLFFKTDKDSVGDYKTARMKPFEPAKTKVMKNFYEVPANVLEDREVLVEWVERAVRA